MATSVRDYPMSMKSGSPFIVAAIFRRVPLVMMTIIFSLISVRYLSNPVTAAAKVGISFTSPGGITIVRVGFAAFPLSFAILAFISLFSERHRLSGLYMVLTVDSIVMAVRTLGIIAAHSMESAKLLAPETVLLVLSLIAIRLEWNAAKAK